MKITPKVHSFLHYMAPIACNKYYKNFNYDFRKPLGSNVLESKQAKEPRALPLASPIVEIITSPVGRQWVVWGPDMFCDLSTSGSRTYKRIKVP